MRTALVSIALAFACAAACGGSGGGNPDADGDGPATGNPGSLTCEQIQVALRARVQSVSHACTTVSDCTNVGWATRDDTFPSCDCAPYYGPSCSGDGVNAAAWAADDRAQDLLDEWETRCVVPGACGMYQICGCDCGRGELICSNNGFCVVGPYNCFPSFDAGID